MYYLLSGAGRFPSSCINNFYHISLLLCTWQQMFSTSPGHITPLSSVGWWKKHFVLYPQQPMKLSMKHPKFMSLAKREILCSSASEHLLCKRISSVALFWKPLGVRTQEWTRPTQHLACEAVSGVGEKSSSIVFLSLFISAHIVHWFWIIHKHSKGSFKALSGRLNNCVNTTQH